MNYFLFYFRIICQYNLYCVLTVFHKMNKGKTQQYLRYCPGGYFNLVSSGRGGCVYLGNRGITELAAVAAAQDVVIWDLRKKERIRVLSGGEKFNYDVTCVASNNSGSLVAVGYTNGCIKLFDTASGESEVTFSGHKNDVTSMCFDEEGMKLVSGSKDTTIIVWDIVAESGLYNYTCLILTVHQSDVSCSTRFEGGLLLADQASPGIQLAVPRQVCVHCQG